MFRRVLDFLRQPDVRRAPLTATWRRLRWHAHWRRPGALPLHLRRWWRDVEIVLPASGSAARAYYEDMAEHDVVRVMERCLRPGMTVLDVGAHVGAYSLVAAKLVGPTGRVWAVEPQPDLAEVIRRNAALNGMTWLQVEECALGAANGVARFAADPQSKGGCIVRDTGSFEVPVVSLDDLCARHSQPHLIKLDAAGNELAVLESGARVLEGHDAPVLIVKLYHTNVVRERFGCDADAILRLLESARYRLRRCDVEPWRPFRPADREGYCVVMTALPESWPEA